MTVNELRTTVRGDDSLSPMARLLFEHITQMCSGDGRCFAEDEWLGKQIGAAASSVRRYRRQLRQSGYIKQYRSNGKRFLEPNTVINIDHNGQDTGEMISNGDQNDQFRSQEVINSDQDIDNNIPAERESAPAHEGSAIDVFADVVGRKLNSYEKDILRQSVDDVGAFREACEEAMLNVRGDPKRVNLEVLISQYQELCADGKLTPEQKEDPDYSVNDNGEPCYKGTPLSEIGPQNLASDL